MRAARESPLASENVGKPFSAIHMGSKSQAGRVEMRVSTPHVCPVAVGMRMSDGPSLHQTLLLDDGSMRTAPEMSSAAMGQPTAKPAAVLTAKQTPAVTAIAKKSRRLL